MVRLGLATNEFFRLTPRQLRVLADRDAERDEQHREHDELCAAIVGHTVASYAGKQLRDGVILTYGHFMPSFHDQIEAARQRKAALSFRGFLDGLAREKGLK